VICFQKIAEKRIKEAIQEGKLDNLPGAGKPLRLEEDSYIPEDLRMAHKILKNAGFVPPEIALKKEIIKTEELLQDMEDTKAKYRQIKKLNYLIMKLNIMRSVPTSLEKNQRYESKILERFES
jgi:hypothetical protein